MLASRTPISRRIRETLKESIVVGDVPRMFAWGTIKVTRDDAVMTLLCVTLVRQFVLKRVYPVMGSLMTEAERNRFTADLFGRVRID